jgi:kynurenine formamidase
MITLPGVTLQEFRSTAERVRNWGRWGADDELGTLNFLTEETSRAAAACVRRGRVFPLGVDFSADGIWSGNSFRRNPVHLMTVDGGDAPILLDQLELAPHLAKALTKSAWGTRLARFNDDFIMMPLQAASQWDALSHVYYDDQLYNGFPASTVTSAGAARVSIDKVDVKGIAGRGVLADLARARGADHLPAGTPVEPDELDDVLARQGSPVRPGDILLVRTGWWPQFKGPGDGDRWRFEAPGLSWRCAAWLHSREIAAVAADNVAVEVSVGGGEVDLPLHLLCLRDMGMMFGEIWNLEELADDSARTGVYDCQLVAPPLRVLGAVGSPVNPVALR